MPIPDLSRRDYPVGPYRDKQIITITTADFVRESGFTCQAAAAGSITYRTLEGQSDLTETVAVGDTISGPGGVPVILQAVRGSSAVKQFVVGVI